jgi:hypothetical protein
MAEIRSTLDMVMERADRMAARAKEAPAGQEAEQRGMRLVADFLSGKQPHLTPLLGQENDTDRIAVRRGMAKGLLRNVVIPRDEDLVAAILSALNGLLELESNNEEVTATCTELQQLTEQYSQHKEQMKQQMEEAIRAQLAQQVQEQSGEVADPTKMDATRHPQYQKEWAQAQTNLNEQYTQAFEQRKELLLQRFSE